MKKALNIFALLTAVILIFGITVSCSKDDNNDDNDKNKTVQKTVFVFHPYADNLTTGGYLNSDLREIKNAITQNGTMSNYRVIVYYATAMYNAVMYEFKLENGTIVNDTLQKYTSIYQSDEQHLTRVFNDVKETAPAKTYTLIIGGHGCGWLPSSINWSNVYKAKESSSKRKSFGSISRETLRIDTSVFGSAMTTSNFYADMTIFDCCYMDNIETIYDVHNNTDYFIALPGEQVASGFNYTNIWNDIIGTANKSTLEDFLSQELTYYDSYNPGYSDASTGKKANPITIAAIDCNKIDELCLAMKNINLKYPETTEDLTNKTQCFDRKPVGVFFDLLDYVKYRVGGDETNYDYLALQTAINNAVAAKQTSGYYLADGSLCFKVNAFCGMACSDPSMNSSVIDVKKNTNWWIATH